LSQVLEPCHENGGGKENESWRIMPGDKEEKSKKT